MRKVLLTALCMLAFPSVAHASSGVDECPNSDLIIATSPVPPQSSGRFKTMEAAIDRSAAESDVLLLGDSQAHRWPADIAGRLSQSGNVARLGLPSETVQDLLWRVSSEYLDRFSPNKIVVMIGGNNLGSLSPCAISAGTIELLNILHERWAAAQVTYIAIPPRGTFFNEHEAARVAVNDAIQVAAQDNAWLDVMSQDDEITCSLQGQVSVLAMLAKDASVSRCRYYANDHKHMSPNGYRFITDRLGEMWSQ